MSVVMFLQLFENHYLWLFFTFLAKISRSYARINANNQNPRHWLITFHSQLKTALKNVTLTRANCIIYTIVQTKGLKTHTLQCYTCLKGLNEGVPHPLLEWKHATQVLQTMWLRVWTKMLADRRIWRKNCTWRIVWFSYPYCESKLSLQL